MSELAGLSTCKLCGMKLYGPPAGTALIIGAGKRDIQRVVGYMNQFAQHFTTRHPQENNALEMHSAQYLGLLRLLNFQTTDAGLSELRDFLRWSIHQSMLPRKLVDEVIQATAATFAAKIVGRIVEISDAHRDAEMTGDTEQGKILAMLTTEVADMLTGLRLRLEEPEKYSLDESGAPVLSPKYTPSPVENTN